MEEEEQEEEEKAVYKKNVTCATEKFEKVSGFQLQDFKSYNRLVKLLYRPTDAASLGVSRALFGLCMVIDVIEERGFADIDLKWGDPYGCHFPLIHGMKPPTLPYMIILYTLMWIGAFGIMLGFCFKITCACFVIPYWYIFVLDKSFWNNHSYLYGIVAILFWGTGANKFFALDAKFTGKSATVPLWNYFILKFQFFALYFLAGLKKSSREWLEGYSMMNLAQHWVFDPFKFFLTTDQIDFLIVHWFGFIFDVTVGFCLLFDKTRIPAMLFCGAFHLMNSRLFTIGMFPYVCLSTMGLFCHFDWPRNIISFFNNSQNLDSKTKEMDNYQEALQIINEKKLRESDENHSINEISRDKKPPNKHKILVSLLFLHIIVQFFLPYSHFITKGYNNWVPGLYGYSWDMMIHSWDTILIVIRIHDNESHEDYFIDPQAWVQNDRWSKHGDMAIQYSQCLKENLYRKKKEISTLSSKLRDINKFSKLSLNLSIYIDVRCSLNGRFQQRVFNPNVDLLTVDWHPLRPVSFLMPLLTQYNSYRKRMEEIIQDVYTWSNYTDVFFVADYSGMQMENYFNNDYSNVSLSVLEGQVTYSEENSSQKISINKYQTSIPVTTEKIHQVIITSPNPACYMYTYTNKTREKLAINGFSSPLRKRVGASILKTFKYKINTWWRALAHIPQLFFYLVYDIPIIPPLP